MLPTHCLRLLFWQKTQQTLEASRRQSKAREGKTGKRRLSQQLVVRGGRERWAAAAPASPELAPAPLRAGALRPARWLPGRTVRAHRQEGRPVGGEAPIIYSTEESDAGAAPTQQECEPTCSSLRGRGADLRARTTRSTPLGAPGRPEAAVERRWGPPGRHTWTWSTAPDTGDPEWGPGSWPPGAWQQEAALTLPADHWPHICRDTESEGPHWSVPINVSEGVGGWGDCRTPSRSAQGHRNNPQKSEVCANSPTRTQSHRLR